MMEIIIFFLIFLCNNILCDCFWRVLFVHTYVLVDIRISIVNVCLASGFFYNFILLQYSVGISVELQHKKFWFLGDSGLFRGSGEHKITQDLYAI